MSMNVEPGDHFGHMQSRDQGWPQAIPQAIPQQLHPASWQQSQLPPSSGGSLPQMHAQGYPNTPQYHQSHSHTPLDFSSLVSQQIMQDFLRLSTPVGASPNDDSILVQALHESKQAGKTYRQALEALHGVNNHAANLWKDYYLDHHDRLDALVARLVEGEQPRTVKKPFVSDKSSVPAKEEAASHQVARKRHHSSPLPPPTLSPPSPASKKQGRSSGPSQASRRKRATPQPVTTPTSAFARPPKRPRATLNSLSAPLPSNDVPNLMPPQVHIPLPDPPSRSPSPPALVQIGSNGNKYTKEDRDYFIKFLIWRLKQNPSLTKKEICELLHARVPHHTVNSWASHWHQRHDIADKIFATYHNSSGVDSDDQDQQDEEEEGEVEAEIKNDDNYDAESETVSANEPSRGQRGKHRSEGTFSVYGDLDVATEEDEADMGEFGSSFTRGDWCMLARFIARNHWDQMSNKERWNTFTETYGTKRNSKSWAEFYRKNEAAIVKLSKKYSPELRNGHKLRRGRISRRSKWEASLEPGLDEDGEYETDNEGN